LRFDLKNVFILFYFDQNDKYNRQYVTQCEPDSKVKKRTLTAALEYQHYYI